MQFKGFIEFSFLVEDLYFFVLHFMHSRHFNPYSLYVGSVNAVAKASHQLNRADYFNEMSFHEIQLIKTNYSKLFFLSL